MLYHYSGLSAQQVINNRQRFGENTITPPVPIPVMEKLQQVSSFWLIRVLVIMQLVACFVLLLLDILLSNLSLSKALILLLLAGIILLVYFVSLLIGHWNVSKQRQEVNPLFTVLLIILTLVCFVAYYQTIFVRKDSPQLYWSAIIIGIVIVVATTLAYLLERKAHKKLSALDSHVYEVIREGNITHVPINEIVVGDIIVLKKGDKVPADAELLEANHLVVDESPLLGKPRCRKKPIYINANKKTTIPLDQIMKGSIVLKGNAIAEVFAVGNNTFQSNIEIQFPKWKIFSEKIVHC